MSDTDTRTTKELFRQWRSGDPEAGQIMAQRFADWYYAIATSRLGESLGRDPCQKACERFGEGVVNVTDVRALVKWAHGLIDEEVKNVRAERVEDGDEASAYTANKSPKTLLVRARSALPQEVELVETCYRRAVPDEEIEKLAEPLGGMPLGRTQGAVPHQTMAARQRGRAVRGRPGQPRPGPGTPAIVRVGPHGHAG